MFYKKNTTTIIDWCTVLRISPHIFFILLIPIAFLSLSEGFEHEDHLNLVQVCVEYCQSTQYEYDLSVSLCEEGCNEVSEEFLRGAFIVRE